MAALSRLRTVSTECHCLTHPWNRSCVGAIADVVPRSLLFSVQTYLSFYALAHGMRWLRSGRLDWRRLGRDTARSVLFLTSNMCIYLYCSCLLRRVFGCYTWLTYYAAGIMGSFLSIIQEQQKRRPMLALYLTNLASETLFYQLRNRNLVPTVPHFHVFIFSVALGLLFYFRAKKISSQDADSLINLSHNLGYNEETLNSATIPLRIRDFLHKLRSNVRGSRCGHVHSCVSKAVEPSLVNFGYGLLISSSLALLQSLKKPKKVVSNLLSWRTLALPAFACLMPAIYNGLTCVLRNRTKISTERIEAVSGFASGAAMFAFPNTTIAMYMLWKALERIYHVAADKGYAPRFKHGDILLYSVMTGYIVGNCVVEPHSIRPGYFQFIRGLTVNHIDYLHRFHLAPFGFDSERYYINNPHIPTVKAAI